MKTYPIEHQIRHQIKRGLIKHMSVNIRNGVYVIKIRAKDWHEIFKTQELNESGITFDRDYR